MTLKKKMKKKSRMKFSFIIIYECICFTGNPFSLYYKILIFRNMTRNPFSLYQHIKYLKTKLI